VRPLSLGLGDVRVLTPCVLLCVRTLAVS